ncbi:hypothetical protein MMC13_000262 [Lambiella insularis]|nr:hypothetical protein [Lambiella insularis]
MPLLRVKDRSIRASREERSKLHTFDEKSGLQYTETVLRAAPMRADWVWKTRGSTEEVALFRSPGPGCSTLRNMAIRKACLHVVSLTSDSLVGLDWQVGKGLWERIVAMELDSLYAWRLFAAAYPSETNESLNRRYQIMRKPNMELSHYLKPINSPSFQWITFLSLSHLTCSYTDLINVSKLNNLGALTIDHGVEVSLDKGVDDSLVRAWSRAATESGSFSRLLVIACRMQKIITARIFQYLTSFSALALFLVEDCNIGPKDKPLAQALGWNYSTGKDLREVLVQSGVRNNAWDSVIHACHKKATEIAIASAAPRDAKSTSSLSVLHFALGGAPTDAMTDVKGDRHLRCFHRAVPPNPEKRVLQVPAKRLPDELPRSQPFKKRIVKTMRKQHAGSCLTEFGF